MDIAYRIPGVSHEDAKDHPTLARLRDAGRWNYTFDGAGACIAYQGKGCDLLKGEPKRQTAEGWDYFVGELPALHELAKPVAEGICHRIESPAGELLIAPAVASVRALSVTTGRLGSYLTEYARLSETVRDRMAEEKRAHDKDPTSVPAEGSQETWDLSVRLAAMAIRQAYAVTDEVIDDLGLVTTGNLWLIVGATFRFPKAEPAAEPSLSPLRETAPPSP